MSSARAFFEGSHGLAASYGRSIWRNRRFAPLVDPIYDARLRAGSAYKALTAALPGQTPRRVLVVGVAVESRPEMMARVLSALTSTVHHVVTATRGVGGRSKLGNINLLLAEHDLADFDWVLMIDDDIELPERALDLFVAACEALDLKIAMPAHRFSSYVGYELSRRGWATLARETRYVEVGPLTAFHRDTFPFVFPLPDLRYGWGVDLHWPVLAQRNGWRMGVVDATPMRHVRPIGGSYSRADATDEACAYLAEHAHLTREETFSVVHRHLA